MINSRIRGFALIHFAIQSILAMALFWLWVSVNFPLIRAEYPLWNKYLMYSALVGISFALDVFRLNWKGLNILHLDLLRYRRNTLRQLSNVLILLLIYLVATKDVSISRLFLFSFFVPLWGLLYLTNKHLPQFLGRILFGNKRSQRTLIFGQPEDIPKLDHWLRKKSIFGLQVVGMISPSGALSSLKSLIEELKIHLVVNTQITDYRALGPLHELCESAGARLIGVHDLNDLLGKQLQVYQDENLHVMTLRQEPLECPVNRLFKRMIDIILSLFVIVFILPWTTVLVWVMHRFQSPGPLLFRQYRTGLYQKTFPIFKYRTMHVGHDEEQRQATNKDPRVFPLGLWLRRQSIDELPQFLNVLRGDMSIVGPRPHFFKHDPIFDKMSPSYRVRSFIKPGITGLAQIRGLRGETSTDDLLKARVQSDLNYAEHWTAALDCLIILRTAWQLIRPSKTAY